MEELRSNNDNEIAQGQGYMRNGCSSSDNSTGRLIVSGTNINVPHIESINLKSNLKKTTIMEAENQIKTTEKRNVTWPDAHGKDIAHVLEFEPSEWEEGELEGVRNSCVCAIQ